MQGFYWDAPSDGGNPWWDQVAAQSSSLAHAGFTAIWLPPPQKGAAGGYSNGYDPFDDYDLGSKDQKGTYPTHWGTREQLTRTVAMLRANGLQVYADMVLHHRNGDDGKRSFLYKDALGNSQGGRFEKGAFDFVPGTSDFGLAFVFGSDYVAKNLMQAGDWLIKALDLQGVRIDYAKGISSDFLKNYLGYGALSNKVAIAEFWEDRDSISHFVHEQMNSRVLAFDFPLWTELRNMANSKGFYDMRGLVQAGFLNQDPDHAVTFVENHDTDRTMATLQNKHLGYAYILTSQGYPSVFWKDYFNYGMAPVINNLIWVHENLASGGTVNRWADQNLLAYERTGGSGLLVGLNDNMNSPRGAWVQTGFGPRVSLHDYTGHQPDLQTNDQGQVQLGVPANSYVAYSRTGIAGIPHDASYMVEQEFAGAKDLDLAPADNQGFHTVARIYVAQGSPLIWDVNYETGGWTDSSQFAMRILSPDHEVFAKQSYGKEGRCQGQVMARQKSWYSLEAKTVAAPQQFTNFWWRQKYLAPKEL